MFQGISPQKMVKQYGTIAVDIRRAATDVPAASSVVKRGHL